MIRMQWCLNFIVTGVCVWGVVASSVAQDEKSAAKGDKTEAKAPAAKEEAPKTDNPKDNPAKDDGAKNEAPKSDAAPAAKPEKKPAVASTGEFQKLFEQWKGIIKDLRSIRTEYSKVGKPEDAKPLETQWTALVAKGNELLPQLRQAAKVEFTEARSNDPQLQRFLLKLAQDSVDQDDYEVGAELAGALLKRYEEDGAPPPQELNYVAGVCEFASNDFENAKKHLTLAKESDSLKGEGKQAKQTTQGEMFLKLSDKYQEYWAQEKAIREKETAANDLPRVKMETTAGTMVIELFENEAPETVGNFVSLVEAGFYNGLVFHRVLPGFMAQGGCPQGRGTGDAGYKIYCETDKPEHRRHFRGSLSMAHAGKNTGGSQFFICFAPQESLDGKHTVFGRVIEGLDTLAKIHRVDPEKPSDSERTKIVKAEVIRKRDHKYLPRKVE